jgi:hypothetical protein
VGFTLTLSPKWGCDIMVKIGKGMIINKNGLGVEFELKNLKA